MDVSGFLLPQPGAQTLTDPDLVACCRRELVDTGYVLLRGFDSDLDSFSRLVGAFCTRLTFDPAREYTSSTTQKVDAGTAAVGLHIENGNTPFPPDMIGFYCKRTAADGSSTTLCDGVEVFNHMDDTLRQRFSGTLTVSRNLPEHLWKQYAANEHPGIADVGEVKGTHLYEILSIIPNHRGTLNQDGSLEYELDFHPVIRSTLCHRQAFANAILGPSFNYQEPVYRFEDGTTVSGVQKSRLAKLADSFILDIPWRDGDIALIDNKRVMHGRREIRDSQNRQLYIAMGLF